MSIISLDDLIGKLASKKQEQGLKFAKKINASYIPTREKELIKLNKSVVCSVGNFSFVIAPPGTGKSALCEAIGAGAANPECDALGFGINCSKALLVDTERVHNDVFRGYKRIKSRSGLSDEELDQKLHVFSLVEAEGSEAAKSELEHIISTGNYELVIIDGSADFVKSVNDEEESKNFWRWLIKLMNQKGFGCLITIHPNPEDKQGKATGHLGSQGQKKAESVFNVFKSLDDKDIRMITTETPHGKVRNAPDGLTASFTWDKEQGMFMGCDRPERRKKNDITDLFTEEKSMYTYKELCKAGKEALGCSLATVRRRIDEAVTLEDLVKLNGFYSLNGTTTIREDEIGDGMVIDEGDDDIPF